MLGKSYNRYVAFGGEDMPRGFPRPRFVPENPMTGLPFKNESEQNSKKVNDFVQNSLKERKNSQESKKLLNGDILNPVDTINKNNEYKNLPIPYVAQDFNSPALLDSYRDYEVMIEKLCQVCGLGFESDETKCFIAHNESNHVMHDHGLTHPKCAKIVEKFCPAFTGDERYPQFRMVETTYLKAKLELDNLINNVKTIKQFVKEDGSLDKEKLRKEADILNRKPIVKKKNEENE